MKWLGRAFGRGERRSDAAGKVPRNTSPTPLAPVSRGNIIADFGEVLEAQSHHTYGITENLLPHPRALIEQALREEFLATRDPDKSNAVEVGYMQLAQFLPEPDGSIAMAITRTLASKPPSDPALAAAEYVDDPEWQAAMQQSIRLAALVAERSHKALDEVRALRNLRAAKPNA